jgi:hypothetical protein
MQASVSDGFAFDPFSFQQDGLTASEVDVGRRSLSRAASIVSADAAICNFAFKLSMSKMICVGRLLVFP